MLVSLSQILITSPRWFSGGPGSILFRVFVAFERVVRINFDRYVSIRFIAGLALSIFATFRSPRKRLTLFTELSISNRKFVLFDALVLSRRIQGIHGKYFVVAGKGLANAVYRVPSIIAIRLILFPIVAWNWIARALAWLEFALGLRPRLRSAVALINRSFMKRDCNGIVEIWGYVKPNIHRSTRARQI